MTANHKPGTWRGIAIHPGEFAGGRIGLSEETGISERTIRTCLKRLQVTNQLTIKSTNKISVFKIINWEKYQGAIDDDQQTDTKVTHKVTTNNKPKKERRENLNISFEEYCSKYPKTEQGVSAEKTWGRLSDEERETAIAFIEPYKASKSELKFCLGLNNYLLEKPWTKAKQEIPLEQPKERVIVPLPEFGSFEETGVF
jgi:hypothetical protein